jgi:hypothetical protein
MTVDQFRIIQGLIASLTGEQIAALQVALDGGDDTLLRLLRLEVIERADTSGLEPLAQHNNEAGETFDLKLYLEVKETRTHGENTN